MRRRPLHVFEGPWILLCEGEGDKRFFDRLIHEKGIAPEFDVIFPARDERDSGGRPKFGGWLDRRRQDSESFNEKVKAVLIVSDNDDNEAKSFELVQQQIQKAPGFPVPNAAQTVARAPGFPAIVILMIPMNGPGNLETLCLLATEMWGLTDALNTFVAQTPANEWGPSKQSKMRLQTTLAAICKRKPDTNFAQSWCLGPRYRIPLDHSCFDPIENFLKNFRNLVS